MKKVIFETNCSNFRINKYRIIEESENRFILEKFKGFWFIWVWEREEIYINSLGKWFYSYKSSNEAIDYFKRDFIY